MFQFLHTIFSYSINIYKLWNISLPKNNNWKLSYKATLIRWFKECVFLIFDIYYSFLHFSENVWPVDGALSSPETFFSSLNSWQTKQLKLWSSLEMSCRHVANGIINMDIDADEPFLDQNSFFRVLIEIILNLRARFYIWYVLVQCWAQFSFIKLLLKFSWWFHMLGPLCHPSFCCKISCAPTDSYWNFSSPLLIFSGVCKCLHGRWETSKLLRTIPFPALRPVH